MVADYLAAGIDPTRSMIFTHGAVPALNELLVPFLSLVSDAELHRNPTVKSRDRGHRQTADWSDADLPRPSGCRHPVLPATLVPVGLDQLPHLELTRLIARRFNDRYAAHPLFPEPEALLTATAGFDGHKMSKTRGNGIPLRRQR
jgi:tryptophanyl-tRNA synthetase